MTSDERTTYRVVQGADLVDISDGVVTMKAVGSGAVEIQVSFPNYMQAQHLAAASVSLTLVQMTGISLTGDAKSIFGIPGTRTEFRYTEN